MGGLSAIRRSGGSRGKGTFSEGLALWLPSLSDLLSVAHLASDVPGSESCAAPHLHYDLIQAHGSLIDRREVIGDGRPDPPPRVELELVSLIVEDYDRAIDFFVGALGFELVEDSPSATNDGRPKRWVVVRPSGTGAGLLLAQADGEAQAAAVGQQFAGRVGFFLRVDDFDAALHRMRAAGVEFVTEPRAEPYGRVAVFLDISGNRWDLLGPADQQA